MKIFKNKVGRPSNKVKRTRKLLIASVSIIAIAIITFGILLLSDVNLLKGGLFSRDIKITDNVFGTSFKKGKEILLYIKFDESKSGKYYYNVEYYYDDNKLIKKTAALIVPKTRQQTKFNLDVDKMYIRVNLCSDTKCEKVVKTSKSKVYRINKGTPSTKIDLTKLFGDYIIMTKYSAKWQVGQVGTVDATVNPKDATVQLKSSNPSVMKVTNVSKNKWELRSIKAGTAKITATSSTGASTSYTYEVVQGSSSSTGGSSSIETETIQLGKRKLFDKNSIASVTSSNTSVIRIVIDGSYYSVNPIRTGTSKVTIKYKSGSEKNINYTVKYDYLAKDRLKKGFDREIMVGETKVFVEKGCSSAVVNSYVDELKRNPNNVKKFTKSIMLMSKSSFDSNWSDNTKTTVGRTYTEKFNIDLVCDKYHRGAISHELAHVVDFEHKLAKGQYASDVNPFSSLYVKYKGNSSMLRPYAYNNAKEFLADSYSVYFQKYNYKKVESPYKSYLPSDITPGIQSLLDFVNNL